MMREQAASVPFASIGVRLGGSSESLLALATREHDVCLWTSAGGLAIETQSGRITRTAGLPHNMSQAAASGSDPIQSGLRSGATCQYAIDIPDRNVYQAAIRYETKATTRDQTVILGGTIDVMHVLEHGSCSALAWAFDNEYWTDPLSGFVWRSRQNIHPDLDAVEIEIFRPPA